MSANPGRRDRWPPYRQVRLVLVRRERHDMPWQGLLIEWRAQAGEWWGLVALMDDEPPMKRGRMVVDWFPASRLTPVRADPNAVSPRPSLISRDGPDF